jgi:hypothetical protein
VDNKQIDNLFKALKVRFLPSLSGVAAPVVLIFSTTQHLYHIDFTDGKA